MFDVPIDPSIFKLVLKPMEGKLDKRKRTTKRNLIGSAVNETALPCFKLSLKMYGSSGT